MGDLLVVRGSRFPPRRAPASRARWCLLVTRRSCRQYDRLVTNCVGRDDDAAIPSDGPDARAARPILERSAAHDEPFTLDPSSVCNRLFPVYSTVRIAAGAPVAGDILKCSLRSVDASAYAVPFTQAEQKRLKAIFPKGVCDYTKPGVKQQPLDGTWLEFGD